MEITLPKEDYGLRLWDSEAPDASHIRAQQDIVNDLEYPQGDALSEGVPGFAEHKGDGIFVRCWHPREAGTSALATKIPNILILPGFSAHAGGFNILGTVLAERGIRVYAMDYPGFGRSEGYRGHTGSYKDMLTSIENVAQEIRQQHSDEPIYILGHSMGGMLATIYGAEHSPDGVILMNPWVKDDSHPSLSRQFMIFIQGLLKSRRYWLNKPDFDHTTTDPEINEKLKQGYPSAQTLFTASFLYQVGLLMRNRAKRDVSKLAVPTLFLRGLEDQTVPPDALLHFYKRVGAQDKEILDYQGGHSPELEMSSNLPEMRAATFAMAGKIADWIQNRMI